jgi:hypothetical protein
MTEKDERRADMGIEHRRIARAAAESQAEIAAQTEVNSENIARLEVEIAEFRAVNQTERLASEIITAIVAAMDDRMKVFLARLDEILSKAMLK